MAYVKIESGIVIQKEPKPREGFIESPDSVVCGMLYDGSSFLPPDIPSSQVDRITKLQAVKYFQNNNVDGSIDEIIAKDAKLKSRYEAASVLVITDPDVISLASAAEALTGKNLQAMFNEASEL